MKPIKNAYAEPSYLGFFFLITAAILFIGVQFGKTLPQAQLERKKWRDAFKIGLWQAFAILPGVSRSGSTISGARLLGWTPNEAITFSFLLAIPTMLGGTSLEVFKFLRNAEPTAEIAIGHYLVGFFVSFVVGLGALRLLMFITAKNKFIYFAWYCLILGLATTCYFHL